VQDTQGYDTSSILKYRGFTEGYAYCFCPLQFTLWICASRRKWEVINIVGNVAEFNKESGEGEIENEGTHALISSLSPPFYGSSHFIDMNGEPYCLILSLIPPK